MHLLSVESNIPWVILTDWVIDLQFVPQSLEEVGELCGFDGVGHLCHKGVLTRCKWMFNDIKRLEGH